MKYFIKCLYNFANFHDRARRKEFWYFILYSSIISVVWFYLWMGIFSILDMVFKESSLKTNDGIFILTILCFSSLYIFLFISFISVSTRRFHDSGISFGNLNYGVVFLLFLLALMGIVDTDNTVKSILGYPRASDAPPLVLSVILMIWGWGLLVYVLYFLLFNKDTAIFNKYGLDPRIDDSIENARKIPKMGNNDLESNSLSDNDSDPSVPKP